MPLGKFQEGLRLCEGVSLGRRKSMYLYPIARARRFSYEDAPAAMSFLNLATATSVFS